MDPLDWLDRMDRWLPRALAALPVLAAIKMALLTGSQRWAALACIGLALAGLWYHGRR